MVVSVWWCMGVFAILDARVHVWLCCIWFFLVFLSVMLVLLSGAPAGFFSVGIGGGRGQWLGGTMARAEHEPITGVWAQSPKRGQGAEPPWSWKHFWSLDVQRSRQIQPLHLYIYFRCNGNDMGKILCRNPAGTWPHLPLPGAPMPAAFYAK